VVNALREQLMRETGRRLAPRLTEELRAIGDRCAALPDYDKRSPEEIMGFDEHGLPA
jgi:antitoxin VapB